MRQRNNGTDDRRALAVIVLGLDEIAIDLDRVEWEPLQVGERRVTTPEVVQSQTRACGPERLQHLRRLFRVLHHERFGNLKPQHTVRNDRTTDDMP